MYSALGGATRQKGIAFHVKQGWLHAQYLTEVYVLKFVYLCDLYPMISRRQGTAWE